ncbi:hypothetical protein N7519_011396 [Penicillium mononematosum]|uniref:uncharacterized protein n=1 Tax=Penicillium mononematosum TaxID=268346 RepID=UPI00254704AB|nr:uncharacterized protein N7519_011396 [Penicillium mononematosum]KAJ6180935.1 hypothetical protein N7519_011396 [Penicillium mononematosum]
MAIIAVAGDTGKLGRAIVEALKTTSNTIYILARQENKVLSDELGITIIPAQYSNIESLTKLPEDNKIDTIVSAIIVVDYDASSSQLNLIAAADQSSSTKRFIPSEYGIAYTEEAKVTNGFFMDYYGLPRVKSYLQPFVFALDMAQNGAAIPGSGNTPVVFTHTFDAARFVTTLTSQANWPKQSVIIGDKKTWNEALAIAEEIKGVLDGVLTVNSGTKFNVAYDDVGKLSTFQVTELPSHSALYPFLPKEQLQYILAVFGRWMDAGDFDLPEIDTLNSRFPEIQPRTLRQVMEEGWKA